MSREQLTGGLLRTGWDRGLLAMVGFSLVLHVVVVALLVVVRPWSRAHSVPPVPVYTVELTSFTTLGSNAVPGAPGERLTGGRAEPAPPKKRVAPKPKPPVQVASKTPPPVEPAPAKAPPPPSPPKVQPPPVAADEPVPAPAPPKEPPPAPEPQAEAKAPAPEPEPEPEVQPDEPSEVPEPAAVAKVAELEKKAEEEPAEAPEEKPQEKADKKPERPDEQAEEKQPEPKTEQAKQPEKPAKPEKPVAEAKQPAAPAEPPQATGQAGEPADVAADATADDGVETDGAGEEETRYAAAIDRIRRRVEEGAGGLMGDGDAGATPAVGGAGPGGGNRVVGAEFLIYYNIMLSHIKRSWLWVGHDDTLSVTVRFQVGRDGVIRDIRLEQASGDGTYDESVMRAVQQANPLPPPPEAHRADFADVKLTFRPGDLRQPG